MQIMIPAWVDDTLTPVEKLEVHKRGLKHKAVSVFVIRGSDVLLQRRAMNKYHTPGLWANTCCTHPLWDEAPMVCATRRLNEELGITGLALEHRHHLEYRADVGPTLTEHEVVDVYLGQASPNLSVMPNPQEVMEIAWVNCNDLQTSVRDDPTRYTPWLRIYLAEHAETIFGAGWMTSQKV